MPTPLDDLPLQLRSTGYNPWPRYLEMNRLYWETHDRWGNLLSEVTHQWDGRVPIEKPVPA